ncbi:MAG: TonB family protein [Candidatus Omnitrophota bacterium]|nr:TonB family protein [Candidatus Omnitrophota bacterium]
MKRIFFAALLISANFLLLPYLDCAIDSAGEEIVLYMNEVEIIPVNNPARVVIANPKVADVANISNKEMTIVPKSPGTTQLVFWDLYGEQSCLIRVYTENMQDIKRRIDVLLQSLNLPEVKTEAQNEEGKVILLGRVKLPQDKDRIMLALGPLKDKTVDLIQVREDESVVEIDVQVLELDKDATDTLGFTWPGSTGNINVTDASMGTTIAGRFQDLLTFNKFTRSALNLTWKMDFLIQEGKVRVLSRPRLACQSGKEAQLLVGGEKPIFTTTVNETGSSSSSTVEYKEYGIKLKIKPNVLEHGRIKLNVNIEVSEVGDVETIGAAAAPTGKAYPFTKRTAVTELFLNNGETMAIGGLIKQKTEEDLRKFPWLADVPVLGNFFRQRTTKTGGGYGQRGNTELFITLTPTVIKSEVAANKVEPPKIVIEPAAAPAKEALPGLAGYTHLVQERISNAIYYPRQAENTGWEGNLKLALLLNAGGDLKEIRLLQSSGYRILDDAAIDVAQKQAPYPPFPPQVESQDLWVEVPIFYKK